MNRGNILCISAITTLGIALMTSATLRHSDFPLPKTPDKRVLGLAGVMIWQQWARIQVSDVKRCAYDLEDPGK